MRNGLDRTTTTLITTTDYDQEVINIASHQRKTVPAHRTLSPEQKNMPRTPTSERKRLSNSYSSPPDIGHVNSHTVTTVITTTDYDEELMSTSPPHRRSPPHTKSPPQHLTPSPERKKSPLSRSASFEPPRTPSPHSPSPRRQSPPSRAPSPRTPNTERKWLSNSNLSSPGNRSPSPSDGNDFVPQPNNNQLGVGYVRLRRASAPDVTEDEVETTQRLSTNFNHNNRAKRKSAPHIFDNMALQMPQQQPSSPPAASQLSPTHRLLVVTDRRRYSAPDISSEEINRLRKLESRNFSDSPAETEHSESFSSINVSTHRLREFAKDDGGESHLAIHTPPAFRCKSPIVRRKSYNADSEDSFSNDYV